MSNPNFNTPPSGSGSQRSRSRLPNVSPHPDDAFRLESSPMQFPPYTSPQFSYMGLLSGNLGGFQQPLFFEQPPQNPTPSEFRIPRQTQESDSDKEEEEEQEEQEEEEEDEVEEIIPETQPTGKRKTRRQQTTGRATNKKWTNDEEVALVQAWIDTSEDNVVGTNQKRSDFWLRVTRKFLEIMGLGNYRSYDQCNSKWRDINKKCSLFTGIFNNVKNNWRSGASDADIVNVALDRFRHENNGKPFVYLKAWHILRISPKWAPMDPMDRPPSQASKRSKTSSSPMTSDGRCQVNINSPNDPNEEVAEAIPNLQLPQA